MIIQSVAVKARRLAPSSKRMTWDHNFHPAFSSLHGFGMFRLLWVELLVTRLLIPFCWNNAWDDAAVATSWESRASATKEGFDNTQLNVRAATRILMGHASKQKYSWMVAAASSEAYAQFSLQYQILGSDARVSSSLQGENCVRVFCGQAALTSNMICNDMII